ncbi:CTD (Carboxy-terminal domain, RNA polymerase II, polypeptide A) small [Aphanomyces cochlioides]|nr:CTD (Carboxy-terminal domain, RNA polymerase II, polypeptide A) small [Aphanomyces cochlioides]
MDRTTDGTPEERPTGVGMWIEETWHNVLRLFCWKHPDVWDGLTQASDASRVEHALIATSESPRIFFLVDDHPIRSMEIHTGDSINELHHLVLLVIKLDRAIERREIQATVLGRYWIDCIHAALTAKVKANESLPIEQSQRTIATLRATIVSKDLTMDSTWRGWLDKEFKCILRLGTLSQPLSLQRKCLVLDLDRTIWFRSFRTLPSADFVATLQMTHSKTSRDVHVSVRPGVQHLLESLSPHYDIIVFTASDRKFTESLIDHIDPDKLIQCRLYRDSCRLYPETGELIKDLTLLRRNLKNVVLVDDNPHVCGHHAANAWICSQYHGDKKDTELYHITNHLQRLRYVEDIRQHLNTGSPKMEQQPTVAKSTAA